MTDYRQTIIDAFEIMRKKSIGEPFKVRAYQTIITQLTSMATFTKEDLPTLKGAGEKITKKIEEIMETGQLQAAEKAKQDMNLDALDIFQKIYGVGPVKAQHLVDMGITSIAVLRQEVKKNPALLNVNQQIGLEYYEPLLERIPYAEMEEHERVLLSVLDSVNANAIGTVVGSYRRGALHSGDIDFLIRGKVDIASFVDALGEYGYLVSILAQGATKCMAICSIGTPRRLDILVTPENEYAYALLYFTGSQQFNIAFRQHALEMGYTMNEHGMKAIRANVVAVPYIDREEDIFDFLGLRYVAPEERINGQIVRK
jgi:DNA polymerase beta